MGAGATEAREAGSPGAAVTSRCELFDVDAENGTLQEQQSLLTTEPSLLKGVKTTVIHSNIYQIQTPSN